MHDAKDQFVVMVGLPRSGKTTAIKRHFIPNGYTRVCPDDVRIAFHGERFIPKAEPFVWVVVRLMVESLLLSGNKVVLDGTFTTRKRREPWEIFNATYCWVTTSKEVCLDRAREENDNEIILTIERQADYFEPPEIYFVVE